MHQETLRKHMYLEAIRIPAEYVYQYAKAINRCYKKKGITTKHLRDIGGVYGSSMTSELRTKNDFIRRLTKYRKGQKDWSKERFKLYRRS